jgi:hypothetical protein
VNATTTTTSTAVRRATAGAVLSVAAILTAAPAYAAPAPEAPVADSSSQHSKAAIERAERTHGTYRTSGTPGVLSAQVKAQIEHMEQATIDGQPAAQTPSSPTPDSDPSSVPVTVLALIGGTLVAGAAGYTVYRFRHHGPVGAATA